MYLQRQRARGDAVHHPLAAPSRLHQFGPPPGDKVEPGAATEKITIAAATEEPPRRSYPTPSPPDP
jgi:hypothetical protein